MWNKPYELIMKLKQDYISVMGEVDTFDINKWFEVVNKKEYNDFKEPLQINQFNEFILIRYGIAEMQRGMWDDKNSIYRQCRSLVVDLKREEIVLSPPRKFFNLDEVKENEIGVITEKIKNGNVVEFSNKLDGSMQNFRWYNGNIFGSGSMALDRENSWRLDDGFNLITNKHVDMLKANPNCTFMFEFISEKDTHVVIYNEKDYGLHLIGIIDVDSGYEWNYSEIEELGEKYDVKYVGIEKVSIDEVLSKMKEVKSYEKEGWVLNIDGHRVKIKCDDYVSLHRMLDKLSSVNMLIENVANDTIDDLMSKLPKQYRGRVNKVLDIIYDYVKSENNIINSYYEEVRDVKDRKSAMIWISDNVPKEIKSYVISKYLGREYNLLKSKSGAYRKMSSITNNSVELDLMG